MLPVRVQDRKFGKGPTPPVFLAGKIPHDVVERGAQVVDEVSKYQRDRRKPRLVDSHPPDVVAALRTLVNNNSLAGEVEFKRFGRLLQLVEVDPSPLHLRPYAIEVWHEPDAG